MLDINTYYQDIKTGEFPNLSNSEYYCIKALNSSSLKFGEKSPLHTDLALNNKLKSIKNEQNAELKKDSQLSDFRP